MLVISSYIIKKYHFTFLYSNINLLNFRIIMKPILLILNSQTQYVDDFGLKINLLINVKKTFENQNFEIKIATDEGNITFKRKKTSD